MNLTFSWFAIADAVTKLFLTRRLPDTTRARTADIPASCATVIVRKTIMSAVSTVTFTQSNPAEIAAGILQQARERARRERLPYAGVVHPEDAWALVSSGTAILVDVRSAEELKFVGHVPNAGHAAWQIGTPLAPNPDFLADLERATSAKDQVILLLCRSGKRSAAAARAATAAGYSSVFSVLEGFEGDLGTGSQRGSVNGWRHRGLPWVQD